MAYYCYLDYYDLDYYYTIIVHKTLLAVSVTDQ